MRRRNPRRVDLFSMMSVLFLVLLAVLETPFQNLEGIEIRMKMNNRATTTTTTASNSTKAGTVTAIASANDNLRRSISQQEQQALPPSFSTSSDNVIVVTDSSRSEDSNGKQFFASAEVKEEVTSAATASASVAKKKKNLTVIMDLSTFRDASFSMFISKTVERYSSPRNGFTYQLERGKCNGVHVFNDTTRSRCMVATNVLDRIPGCHRVYPNCKVMLISDEYCHQPEPKKKRKQLTKYQAAIHVDVRLGYDGQQYDYSLTKYLPLGPRYDFWEAYQNITSAASKSRNLAAVPPSSERKYIFNAIFSSQTSSSRQYLASIIEREELNNWYSNVVRIAGGWIAPDKLASSNSTDVLRPTQYAQTLLDSIFTLAPRGHSPECFRLYEAMEAGSIPIIVIDSSYRNHNCTDALRRMMDFETVETTAIVDGDDYDSNATMPFFKVEKDETILMQPLIVLQSWDELYPTLRILLKNLALLNQRQAALLVWYKRFMQSMVSDFESMFLVEDTADSHIEGRVDITTS